MIPPTSVVLPEGNGGGSRMGSCPFVARPPDVAELSRISVLGCGGGVGGTSLAVAALLDPGRRLLVDAPAVVPEGWGAADVGAAPVLVAGVGVVGCVPAGPATEDCPWGDALGGCGAASGVCGVPEEFFGSEVVGCCCAYKQALSSRSITASNEERCILLFNRPERGPSSISVGCSSQQLRWQPLYL